jgi:Mg-chelatase subunit ChlD
MQRNAKRSTRILGCSLVLAGLAGCTSQSDRDARAADEARRYQVAQHPWESANATPAATTLTGNATGAIAGTIKVAGIETEAARVIFVIDGSGSMIRKRNVGKKVRINTIGTERSEDYDKLLRQIAEENGGEFRHLGG